MPSFVTVAAPGVLADSAALIAARTGTLPARSIYRCTEIERACDSVTPADLRIHDARIIRDAERADPRIVRRTLDANRQKY
jgi:hypothetical protein